MTRTRTAAALAAIATLVTAPTAISAPSDVERSLESAAQRAQASTLGERQERGTFTAQGLIGTPGVFSDAIGDSSLAPDLQGMVVGVDETGTFGTLIRLNSNSLLEGDVVATYVDTDGNQATGSPTFDGADVAVYIIGQIGTDSVAFLRWNGTAMVAAPMPPSLGSVWDGATDEFWSASLTDLGIAPGTRVGILFATLYIGTYDTYSDFAPEPGYGAFTVDIPGPVSAPPPATTPPASTTPVTVPPPIAIDGTPPPPALLISGMSLRRVGRDVRVRLTWRGATARPVSYRLQLRCQGTVRSFGGPTRKGLAVNRRVRIPAVCGRAPVQVRATLSNGTHRVTLTRTLA